MKQIDAGKSAFDAAVVPGSTVTLEQGWGMKGGEFGQDFKRLSKATTAVVVGPAQIGGQIYVKVDGQQWAVPVRAVKE